MIAYILLLVVLCKPALTAPTDAWTEYKLKYRKSYKTREEDDMRKALWEKNTTKVLALSKEANRSFTMEVNALADLTEEESLTWKNGKPPKSFPGAKTRPILQSAGRLPSFVSYHNSSCMPAIKNQGLCGSCWAFAATAAVEYYNCVKNKGEINIFSEQDMVDCSPRDYSCKGGFYTSAWDFVKSVKGQCRAKDYPYFSGETNKNGACMRSLCKSLGSVSGYVSVPSDESAMAHVLANVGPIAIAVDATDFLDFYASGIVDHKECSKTKVNHAALLVGYGTDKIYGDYWIVRNSMSENWGEKGHFRIKRGVNMCGIANYPFYPTV